MSPSEPGALRAATDTPYTNHARGPLPPFYPGSQEGPCGPPKIFVFFRGGSIKVPIKNRYTPRLFFHFFSMLPDAKAGPRDQGQLTNPPFWQFRPLLTPHQSLVFFWGGGA